MIKNVFIILILALLSSCSGDTVTNEFNNANDPGNTGGNGGGNDGGGSSPPEIYISSISGASVTDPSENVTIFVSYDANDRVSSMSDGEGAVTFVYIDGELTNVAGEGDIFNVEELYGSPYDAFEAGEVLQYDNNGNPTLISFMEEEYDYDTDTYTTVYYTAEIYYDTSKPNPYFYTLQAAGVIDVLDDVQLNFSMNPQSPEIVQARLLFPLNNITRIVYKDEANVVLSQILVDYVYNADNHPITATVTGTIPSDNETGIYTLTYTYRQ